MLFKVDENLHDDVAVLLRQQGHDALGVYDQQMQGHTDDDVASVCRREGRVIVRVGRYVNKCRGQPRHTFLLCGNVFRTHRVVLFERLVDPRILRQVFDEVIGLEH